MAADRIIRASSAESRSLANLSEEAEDKWARFTTYPDDHGRFRIDPEVIARDRWKLRPSMNGERMLALMKEWEREGCLRVWQDGDDFLGVINVEKHSCKRYRKQSSWPEPHQNLPRFTHVLQGFDTLADFMAMWDRLRRRGQVEPVTPPATKEPATATTAEEVAGAKQEVAEKPRESAPPAERKRDLSAESTAPRTIPPEVQKAAHDLTGGTLSSSDQDRLRQYCAKYPSAWVVAACGACKAAQKCPPPRGRIAYVGGILEGYAENDPPGPRQAGRREQPPPGRSQREIYARERERLQREEGIA